MAPENKGFNFSTFQLTSIFPNIFLTCPTILTHYYPEYMQHYKLLILPTHLLTEEYFTINKLELVAPKEKL